MESSSAVGEDVADHDVRDLEHARALGIEFRLQGLVRVGRDVRALRVRHGRVVLVRRVVRRLARQAGDDAQADEVVTVLVLREITGVLRHDLRSGSRHDLPVHVDVEVFERHVVGGLRLQVVQLDDVLLGRDFVHPLEEGEVHASGHGLGLHLAHRGLDTDVAGLDLRTADGGEREDCDCEKTFHVAPKRV
jgi:hypothetical protein